MGNNDEAYFCGPKYLLLQFEFWWGIFGKSTGLRTTEGYSKQILVKF
jgi:hypothetical protein